MHRVTWILQILLGIYFVAIGVLHLVVPEGLPEPMAWMYDLPQWVHVVSGTAEILGGLGLILPGLTRILPGLTPLAASGLVIVMLGAATWHATRAEYDSIAGNLIAAALLVFVAWVRWRKHPLPARE